VENLWCETDRHIVACSEAPWVRPRTRRTRLAGGGGNV
jgi:hypothetical protein